MITQMSLLSFSMNDDLDSEDEQEKEEGTVWIQSYKIFFNIRSHHLKKQEYFKIYIIQNYMR